MYASNLHLRIHSNDAPVEAGEYAVQYLFPANLLDLQAAAFAAVVCGLVLSFQDRLADGLLVALDLTVCLLTAAAYVLLLLAGKKTVRDPSESLPETKTERDSAG